MFRKFLFFVSMLAFWSGMAFAQTQPCSTDEHYHRLLKKYPQLADYATQFEAQLTQKIGKRTTVLPDTTIYDIPIAIHVIHDYGVENLSDDALYEAAAYWAIVYMKENGDTTNVITPFKKYIGNPRMRLHLATIDPNGKPTKGITRLQSYLANIGDDQAKYNQWPQDKYVNIWLVGTFGAQDANVAAYAILPDEVSYEPFYDGIICLASYTSSTTKTIPHEMGHILSLWHPWGNTNNPGVACGDDGVDDTPPTLGHMPVGCVAAALYDTTCATGYHQVYLSSDGTVDSLVIYPDTVNSQNIMDYTYCAEMFTKGQAARMRTALNSSTGNRSNLITTANLAATGALAPMPDLPPVADFVVDRADGSGLITDSRNYFLAFNSPLSFSFRNASWNDTLSSVLWSFSNGPLTPTSTNMTTVDNQFSQPGWVTVSLAANSNAGTDTLVNTHCVYAADTTPAGTLDYIQDFTSEASVSNWPMFNYYNNQFKWEFYNGTGYGDNTCVRYHSYDTSQRLTGIAIGDHDDFFTPAFNLDGGTGTVYINFYTSGAYTFNNVGYYDPQQMDSLEVDVSSNGGAAWKKLAGYNNGELANNGNMNDEFIPVSASQWISRSVSVPHYEFSRNTYFRFRYFPGNLGNDLYLDRFSISPFPAGVKEVLNNSGAFDIYPNPASNGATLLFKTGISGSVNYCIKDITGKIVFQDNKEYAPETIQQVEIPRNLTPSSGLYFVTLTVDGLNRTQKLVVY